MPIKEPNRILFISQEIFPYLAEETPIRMLNRQLPELFQTNGYETRTFMPKFGEINERRNQLHEVIRLSGTNFVIEDADHPLLIKVTSVQAARLQIYFIDNDENKINYDISLAINWTAKKTTREERLLMMLAIQDEPIRFLCEMLK